MDLQEMFARIQKGEVAAHSELGTRDEAKQSKNFTARLRRFEAKTNIKAHALMMKDVVIPFNPFTCEADDNYNPRTPFRPILLVSQVLGQLKSFCASNPDIAAKWNKILGAEIAWDAPVSREEYFMFKAKDMIKPRIMSYSTVSLNFGGNAGFSEYRQKYTVDPSQLDSDNNYLPGVNPIWNQAAVFFYSMIKPEIDDVTAQLERQSASKEQIANQKRTIRGKSPVGFVMQTNLIPFIYIPMNEAIQEFDEKRPTDFEACIRWYSYNPDKWSGAVTEAETNNLYDEEMDYYDFTIRTPTSKETKTNGQVYTDADSLELYQAMSITNTDGRVSVWGGQTTVDGKVVQNNDLLAPLWKAAERYFIYSQEQSMIEDGDSFEKLMAASNRMRPITSVMDKFLPACNAVFMQQFADSKYFTPDRKKANAAFFTAMNPDNALALADTDEDELDAAAQQQAQALGDILAAARGDDDDGTSDEDALPLALD